MATTSTQEAATPPDDADGDARTGDADPPYERKLSDGTTLVSARMRLPVGWNKEQVTVEFILSVPYPNAQPDCFFADPDLLLANGATPSNTGQQALEGQPRLWFSWHLTSWDPAHNDINTYLRFIESRFRDAR